MTAVDLALAATALLAGVTGTWSPCGLSTIDTLRTGGLHGGGRGVAAGMTLVFAAGALAGGVVTFGSLSAIGGLVRDGTGTGPTIALALALAAALLELRGGRILPQVRRQVPEPWRRGLPVALAAGLYGILLGLAFTTFVMSFAVWALAGIAVALGEVRTGLIVGLAFGVGRALPVIALAPIADLGIGARLITTMTQRRWPLRGARVLDAVALGACALALAGPASAATAGRAVAFAGRVDPSVTDGELAWQEPGAGGFVRIGHTISALPGVDPALGGGRIAWRTDATITIADARTLTPRFTISAPGADELAVSSTWLVYRVPPTAAHPGRYAMFAQRLPPTQPARQVASTRAPADLGRPALSGRVVVFDADGRRSRILAIDLANGRHLVLRASDDQQLLDPSLRDDQLLYVRADDCRQRLLIGAASPDAHDRVLASGPTQVARDGGYEPGAIREGRTPDHCVGPLAGHFRHTVSYGTTALGPLRAYVTILVRGAGSSSSQIRAVRR